MKIFLANSIPSINNIIVGLKNDKRVFRHPRALQKSINKWSQNVPHIKPYYAVKSNPSPWLLAEMNKYTNLAFDCASYQEVSIANKIGPTKDIILSNPIKRPIDLKNITRDFSNSVNITVIDTVNEIYKIKQYAPQMSCLIRLKANDMGSKCSFSEKFGVATYNGTTQTISHNDRTCDGISGMIVTNRATNRITNRATSEGIPDRSTNTDYGIEEIIYTARKEGVNLVGCSFHIGSGSITNRDKQQIYMESFNQSKLILDLQKKNGFKPYLIDIGGGMEACDDLYNIFRGIQSDEYKIIAEPGRYFSSTTQTLCTQIIGKKSNGYHIDNSIYHDLNCVVHDNYLIPSLDYYYDTNDEQYHKVDRFLDTKLFGATCDGHDIIGPVRLPTNMEVDDYILLENMGAYTNAAAVNFNGIVIK